MLFLFIWVSEELWRTCMFSVCIGCHGDTISKSLRWGIGQSRIVFEFVCILYAFMPYPSYFQVLRSSFSIHVCYTVASENRKGQCFQHLGIGTQGDRQMGKIHHRRLTFTFPVISSASNVAITVTGKSKAEALRLAMIDNIEPDWPSMP